MTTYYEVIADEVMDRLKKSVDAHGGMVQADFIDTRAYLKEDATEHSPSNHVHAVDVEFASTFVACAWIKEARMMAHARFRDAKANPLETVVVTFPLLGFMLAVASQ